MIHKHQTHQAGQGWVSWVLCKDQLESRGVSGYVLLRLSTQAWYSSRAVGRQELHRLLAVELAHDRRCLLNALHGAGATDGSVSRVEQHLH
jgi:hypothetical protein